MDCWCIGRNDFSGFCAREIGPVYAYMYASAYVCMHTVCVHALCTGRNDFSGFCAREIGPVYAYMYASVYVCMHALCIGRND